MGLTYGADSTFLIVDSMPPQFSPFELQVADIQEYSYVAGPGRRCVVWMAGCNRRCPGCFQPQFFSFNAGHRYYVEELAERILRINGIDGVTFSGGEPFEQSEALANLCKILKAQSELSLLSYTGYRLEYLREKSQHGGFLSTLDMLIDGEFRETEAGAYLWRGSRNQRLIDLKGGKPDQPLFLSSLRQHRFRSR